MSYSTCITCGRVIRDHDDVTGMVAQPLGLPEHGCARPVGDFTWNDGKHYWDDDTRTFRPWPPCREITTAASPFSGIDRTVAAPIDWKHAGEPPTPEEMHAATARMIEAPRYRAPIYPHGWTMSELGPLPPGWTVVDGKPVKP